jgi:hypothetical protein
MPIIGKRLKAREEAQVFEAGETNE